MKIVKFLMSLPKTIIFNFRVFPLYIAIKLPVLVFYNVKIDNIYKGCININSDIHRFMIKINIDDGSKGVNYSYKKRGYFSIKRKGVLIFKGNAIFNSGVSIRVDSGVMTIGENFSCNKNCFFSCSESITLGNDVLLGWNVNIRDSDGHTIYKLDDNKVGSSLKPVIIGNHVWLGANVDILKGVKISDNCVVGYRSCVIKEFEEQNCIIGGFPARIIKRNINWIK